MKHQIPVWVALAFLMLFLVVFAGFIFTLQTRGQLVDRVATLEAQATTVQLDTGELVVRATAQSIALDEAVATQGALSAEIDTAQASVAEIAGSIVTPAPAPTATPSPTLAPGEVAPPQVSLITPANGLIVEPGDSVEILLSVTDNAGVDRVTLTVNNDVIGVYSAENQVIYTVKEPWSTEEAGEYKFVASATNSAGVASDTVEATVLVNDREAALRGYISEIQQQVENLRGIKATEEITLTLYTKEELRANFEELFFDEVDEDDARRDVIELFAFDFVELGYDLYGELLDLYSDSVLGFYDPDTKELVVVSDDAELSPAEQLTLAHEITHALQDQQFGLNFDDADSEAAFARRALAEGGATLLQSLYVSGGFFNDEQLSELIEEINASSAPDTSNLPDLILRQQQFPYNEGSAFVNALYQSGGFAAIDEAWANPPQNTEQILHPELYLGDSAEIVILPPLTDTLGAGWEFINEETLGEFSLQLYLEQQSNPADSRTAAAGWDGDRYAVYWNDASQSVVMLLLSVWDDTSDDLEFARTFVDYAGGKYGAPFQSQPDGSRCWTGDDVTCLYQINETTLVIRAPDLATVVAVRGATRIP